jgi:hypothetical protein
MLPNFLIIGSQKAGTTTLFHILKQHPEVYMSKKKEINFFFHEGLFNKGIMYYETFFQNLPLDKQIVGEASPGYLCHPESPIRIHKFLPNVKLLITVRNPIERAYSQYWDNRRRLSESLTFHETIDKYLDDSYEPGKIGYFSRGVYIKYINTYLEYFTHEQIKVMLFEDLITDPSGFYREIFRFLNVKPDFRIDDISKTYNPSSLWDNPFYNFFFSNPHHHKYLHRSLKRFLFWGKKVVYKYPDMSVKDRKRLNEFYEPWNKELSDYLGRELFMWK